MLTRVKMIAMRPLSGDGYKADPDEPFTTDSKNAERLEAKGLAYRVIERPQEKAMRVPENKMMLAVENKAQRVIRR